MARKKKNSIFEDQNALAADAAESQSETTSREVLSPDISKESLVEDIPDSAEQMSQLEDQLSDMSRLQAELNAARQKISQLESEVKRLQSDNDMLVMKLAESAAMQADIPQQPAAQCQPASKTEQKQHAMMASGKPMPVSKRVHYRQPNYGNNGYGTWH